MFKSSKKAFTLLELIVVVVILGILALVAVPSFTSVIGGARDATVEQSARSVAVNANSKAMLNDGADSGVTTVVNIQKAALESGFTLAVANVADAKGYRLTNTNEGVQLSLEKNGKEEIVCIERNNPDVGQPKRAIVRATVGAC